MEKQMVIEAFPSMQDISALHKTLVDWVQHQEAGSEVHLEIEKCQASQPAVQVFLATVAALKAKSVTVVPGQEAALVLSSLVNAEVS